MKQFFFESGKRVNVLLYTQHMIDTFKNVKIYVGCDSQNKRKGCLYATVIAFRYTYDEHGLRWAANYAYHREWVEKTKDKFTRLWGEVERSVEVAQWLEKEGYKVYQIDLDFNEKSNTGSHDMVAAGSGYVLGQGFNCSVKPELQCATRAGDHIVKKKGKRRPHHHKKKRV